MRVFRNSQFIIAADVLGLIRSMTLLEIGAVTEDRGSSVLMLGRALRDFFQVHLILSASHAPRRPQSVDPRAQLPECLARRA